MRTQRRLWRQYLRKHQVGTLIILAFAVAGVFIFAGYWWKWDWTGFYAQSIPNGSLAPKTLWDWMQLFIVPAVLALGAYVLNQAQQARADRAAEAEKQRDREAAEARAKLESESREDTQQEMALQAYLDRMSELLLEQDLKTSQSKDAVRNIARARTLTVLPRLSPTRKRSLMQFVYESGLTKIIQFSQADLSNVDLHGADLSNIGERRIDLSHANLSHTNLSESKLRGANLSYANLHYANLSKADLTEANLKNADLSEANLSGADITPEQLAQAKSLQGATMPDGKLHP